MSEMTLFIPAAFDLYEFDDRGRSRASGVKGRRWFSHWDGLIGSPAEEVDLAWSNGDATVVVCTSGRYYDEVFARIRTAHLALGGNVLPLDDRPESPTGTKREIERIGSSEELWSEIPDILPGGAAAKAFRWEGLAAAYNHLSNGAIFIAAVGVDPRQFRVRRVQDWDVYNVDATTRFPLSALNG